MFYLIDKPIGISSFDVIRKLRKILDTRKIGHTGTLDPAASGCLLLATENSTKLIHELEKNKKRYTFTVRFDGISDSYDTGTPVAYSDIGCILKKSKSEICDFLTTQTSQVPPKYSALHIDGKRAYDLARDGIDFDIPSRPITIEDVVIEDAEHPEYITLSLTISSGGYIRSLAPVLGEFYGVKGGYISSLRRVGIYNGDDFLSITESGSIDNPAPIEYSRLFPTIHTIALSEEEYREILLGKTIHRTEKDSFILGAKYFLSFKDIFMSLCIWEGDYFRILRNNV